MTLQGYDGHVLKAPLVGKHPHIALRIQRSVVAHFNAFVQALRSATPAGVPTPNLFNCGGSSTFSLLLACGPESLGAITELSAGSAVVLPTAFDSFTTAALRPALFFVGRVTKITPRGRAVPFLGSLVPHRGVITQGCAFPSACVDDAAWPSPLWGWPPTNTLPTQAIFHSARRRDDPLAPRVGALWFTRPTQADGMLNYASVCVASDDGDVKVWPTLRVGN